MTHMELLSWGQEQLSGIGIPDAETDAWLLLEYVTGMNRASYFLNRQEVVPARDVESYQQFIRCRSKHVPLQYITGKQDFMGMTFAVSDAVLIPRQDTETLVELALPYVAGKCILDMCTGSGCIAVSLQRLGNPQLCHAVDISKEALAIAGKNIENLDADVQLWQSDLFEQVEESYDVIVSNPPYIPPDVIAGLMPEVREHEPRIALDGGRDGLDFYRRLAEEAGKHLKQNGRLYLEIGYDQGAAVINLLQEQGYQEIRLHQDLAGRDRVVSAVYSLY